MGIDWDDLLAYTTTRSVTVRHRYLGLTYYSMLTLVLVYIFGIQIAMEKKYNVQLDIDGSIQANVEGVGAAALTPLSELEYCNRTYIDGHIYECIYPELATGKLAKTGVGVEGSLLVGTRLSTTVQHLDTRCTDVYRCAAWVPEPGTTAYDDAKTTAFVGDVGRSTIRFQHKVARNTEAAFGLKADEHFLTSFSPKASRAAAGPRMCLEREPSVCVAPQSLLASGDVFSLSQLVSLAGASLDANLTGETSYRYDGLTLKVRVGYSEPQHYDYYLATNELKIKEVFIAPGSSVSSRTLYELHGVQILLSHGGRLGLFSLSQLLLAVITGVGLFSVAKVVTDTMLMYAMPKREAYRLFVRDVTPDFAPVLWRGCSPLCAQPETLYVPACKPLCASLRACAANLQLGSQTTDEERAVLAHVLRAKRGERSFLQGGQLNNGPDAPMLFAPVPGSTSASNSEQQRLRPLSATTVQNAASGDV